MTATTLYTIRDAPGGQVLAVTADPTDAAVASIIDDRYVTAETREVTVG